MVKVRDTDSLTVTNRLPSNTEGGFQFGLETSRSSTAIESGERRRRRRVTTSKGD
ncbi:hypothetical protein HYC85_030882 [Camellia sinensis]|uniref:Uncharacterized protein n=1 Tax=Camellia sinensis TaxID=4442 RepID=A0A7J7FPL8_CAMSI|nr:hypothetical protein HYC85_030882 [Camellia sinensis]